MVMVMNANIEYLKKNVGDKITKLIYMEYI